MEPPGAKPWVLPEQGLAVYYGCKQALRLFHYFLPRILRDGRATLQPADENQNQIQNLNTEDTEAQRTQRRIEDMDGTGRVLVLDGANRFDPLLLARLRRQSGYGGREREPAEWNAQMRVARAFTCFQLTELLLRAPRMLEKFPAGVVIVTALPDLYFDEDVREPAAQATFVEALRALRELSQRPVVSVSVFTEAVAPALRKAEAQQAPPPRRREPFDSAQGRQAPALCRGLREKFFPQLLAAADWVWRMSENEDGRMEMRCEKSSMEVRQFGSSTGL